MATIESYSTSSGKRYQVRYRTPDHRQTKKRGFTTKRDAEAFAATVEVEKLRGEYVAPKLGQVTVGELATDWLERKRTDLKPSTYRTTEVSWNRHVKPRWSKVRIADVDLDAVERWIADMGRTVTDADGAVSKKGSGATVVIRAYGVLAAILDSAVKARRIARNPARTPENLPRKRPKPRTYLTHEQVDQLADEAKGHRTLVLLLAYTGLRWGEAIALRVEHLDLLRKRISVVENAVQIDQRVIVGTPKSHEARSVPVPGFLVVELAQLCQGKAREDLVFDNGRGGYLRRPVSWSGWFAGAVDRSGVPRVTIHDLRHTAASLAVSAGVNIKALQRMLGHASAAMTLDTYADLFDEDLDAVALALDAARSASSVPKVCPDEVQGERGQA
ncbi:tyrosine-type recombinase/integrase [Gordonia sp. SID5947]|uniref:tyrosine-type recombinase/integrase n=1 Tax=Gordonia sp. SID5947 TaxID=2690315 RepID=UPI001370E251|nr:tyrosine-type recombinase/integrase [Gordonia sp. SID5947]